MAALLARGMAGVVTAGVVMAGGAAGGAAAWQAVVHGQCYLGDWERMLDGAEDAPAKAAHRCCRAGGPRAGAS